MNYLKHYCKLIRKAERRQPPNEYTEKHHVFPKSIFGKNSRLVLLTAREHYIAHALLEKIYIKRYGSKDPKTIKMTYAHTAMKANQRYINSYLYQAARVRRSEAMKGKKPYTPTDATRQKIRQARTGTKASLETRKRMSEAHKGRAPCEATKELREKRSQIQKNKTGELNGMYGKCHTTETKQKISLAKKGKPLSQKHKEAISARTKENWESGVFSTDEFRETLSRSRCKKYYKITNKDGVIYYSDNIVKFARRFDIDYSPLYKMAKGKLSYYKNWVSVEIL